MAAWLIKHEIIISELPEVGAKLYGCRQGPLICMSGFMS